MIETTAHSVDIAIQLTLLDKALQEDTANVQNYHQAKTFFEKACNLNVEYGCSLLGLLFLGGQGVKQNKHTAKEYFGKSCDLGFQLGCDAYKDLNKQSY